MKWIDLTQVMSVGCLIADSDQMLVETTHSEYEAVVIVRWIT